MHKLTFQRITGSLTALFAAAPIVMWVLFFIGAPYPNWGPVYHVFLWSLASGFVAGFLALVGFSYEAGRQSTQDPEIAKKEQRRQEYLKLKEEFDDAD